MDKIKRLPDSELEVMVIIWQNGEEIHTGEILQKLSEKKQCNLQMVQSTLNRLSNKGFVSSRKIGKFNYFTPLIGQEQYREQEAVSFVERLYPDSPGKLVATLISKQSLSPEEIAEIRRMLEEVGE